MTIPPEDKRTSRWLTASVLFLTAAAIFVVLSLSPTPKAMVFGGLAVAALLLALLPGIWLAGVFVVGMVAGHLFQSPFTLVAGGIEWHPREMLLFLFLAQALFRLLRGARFPWSDPSTALLALYALFYFHLVFTGFVLGQPVREIVEECRYPIFLLSFVGFTVAVESRDDLYLLLRVVLGVTLLIAGATVVFFLYTICSGETVSVQNYLGEFVRRKIAGHVVQSARPAGHMWFEITLPVLLSLLLGGALSKRAALGVAGAMALLGVALLLGMMRTAFLTAAFSCAVVLFVHLPPGKQRICVLAAAMAATAILLVVLVYVPRLPSLSPEDMEVSLRARLVETLGAWEMIQTRPLLGSGMGSSFEGIGYVAKTSRLSYGPAQYQMLHNSWLYFLMKGGVVGFSAALIAVGGLLLLAWRGIQQSRDSRERALYIGVLAALAGQCIASLTMTRLTYPAGHVLVALVAVSLLRATSKGERTASRLGAETER